MTRKQQQRRQSWAGTASAPDLSPLLTALQSRCCRAAGSLRGCRCSHCCCLLWLMVCLCGCFLPSV